MSCYNNIMVDKLLKSIYYDLKSPLAYTSKQNVFREAKKHLPEINRTDVDLWFENQLAPTLHKPVRYRFKRNKTVVKGVGNNFKVICAICRILNSIMITILFC